MCEIFLHLSPTRSDSRGDKALRPTGRSAVSRYLDHKRPVSKGGSNRLGNLQIMQTSENRRKGTGTPTFRFAETRNAPLVGVDSEPLLLFVRQGAGHCDVQYA